MTIKRTVARAKIALRKRQRARAEREVKNLTIARNKALKEAERAVKKAELQEELRQAKLKKYKAEAPGRGKIKATVKKFWKDFRKMQKSYNKKRR